MVNVSVIVVPSVVRVVVPVEVMVVVPFTVGVLVVGDAVEEDDVADGVQLGRVKVPL